jgi:hypothetical protein
VYTAELRIARLLGVAVLIAVVSYVVIGLRVNSVLQPTLRASGEPDTAEVTIRVRNVFLGKHGEVSACDQPSAGHWTCSVRFADGRKGIARAVWHGRTEKLSVSPFVGAGAAT